MTAFPASNRSCPLLQTMLNCIYLVYPDELVNLKKKTSPSIVLNEESIRPIFDCIRRIGPGLSEETKSTPNLFVLSEEARSMRDNEKILLPKRYIFTGPYWRVTYEGVHTTPEGKDVSGRLIFEFFDDVKKSQANEMVWFIFTYEGINKTLTRATVKTTRAFRAFETNVLDDFKDLHPFLIVYMRQDKLSSLMKMLLLDVDNVYKDNDERSRGFLLTKAVYETPAPVFKFP